MNRRHEILRATSEAARVFAQFPRGRRTSFDVVRAVTERNIPLLFRPLDGLWGAFIAVGHEERGIIVTTKLALSVQRFTLAHELGHLLLGHESSLDRTTGLALRNPDGVRSVAEAAADTFAAELLAPRQLIRASASRQRWGLGDLRHPDNIYQLGLRLGISYKSACWSLAASGVLSTTDAARLDDERVRNLKLALAPAELLTNSWADVWSISRADTNTFLEAGPDDLFAIRLQDHASAGYLWQLVDPGESAEIVDESSASSTEQYGQPYGRVVHVRFRRPGIHRMLFEHVRPWSRATLETIEIEIDSFGKERDGWPRRVKAMAGAHP